MGSQKHNNGKFVKNMFKIKKKFTKTSTLKNYLLKSKN